MLESKACPSLIFKSTNCREANHELLGISPGEGTREEGSKRKGARGRTEPISLLKLKFFKSTIKKTLREEGFKDKSLMIVLKNP